MKTSIAFASGSGIVSTAFSALPAAAQVGPAGDAYMWHAAGWGHMVGGMAMMILFWGGLIVVGVLAVRWLGSSSNRAGAAPDRAADILRERFARGEIDKNEYEDRKRALAG